MSMVLRFNKYRIRDIYYTSKTFKVPVTFVALFRINKIIRLSLSVDKKGLDLTHF